MAETLGVMCARRAHTTQPISDCCMGSINAPVKVLQNIIRKGISGRLILGNTQGDRSFWQLHIGKGQLHYATSTEGNIERLRYGLQRHYPALVSQIPDHLEGNEYDWLKDRWQRGQLPLASLRTILQGLSQEAMAHLLSLRQASLQFDRQIGLSSILIYQDFREVIVPIADRVRHWQQLQPHFASALQRTYLSQDHALTLDHLQHVQSLCPIPGDVNLPELLGQNRCLYDIATTLRCDTLSLARALRPLVVDGVVALYPYGWEEHLSRPKVACIDDSSTVQRNVKLVLESAGCRVISVTQPLAALSSLGRDAPDLILLDINMPDLDGYTLCRMLRQCTALKETPIVMLTGRDALIDKVKARLLGASDYITKPFTPSDLTQLITKYITVENTP